MDDHSEGLAVAAEERLDRSHWAVNPLTGELYDPTVPAFTPEQAAVVARAFRWAEESRSPR